ncbi:MAG: type II toxin-antitoxin system VapC family toxin [Methylobacillus sp.]|jgi:predicted nucleic acid-binding protein|nr:type II toxin-antitoxin system VapC family toxin [Methylobacillus sp.]
MSAHPMLLLDTNVISEIRKSTCDPNVQAWVSKQASATLYISAITVLETQRGISQAARRGDEQQATVLNRWLEDMLLPTFADRILPVDHAIARRAGRLKWMSDHDVRDPLIAATGLVHDATVVTRNTKHFAGFGVRLINPWDYKV